MHAVIYYIVLKGYKKQLLLPFPGSLLGVIQSVDWPFILHISHFQETAVVIL